MTKAQQQRQLKEIIKQEVHAMLFSVVIPDVPWSHISHKLRDCMMPGCDERFDPKRWYSRFCSLECGRAHYRLTLSNWRARKRGER